MDHTVSDKKIASDFSDIQILHNFTGWRTPKLDCEVTIFFNVKYLENGTKDSYIYNGRLTESRIWSIEWSHFHLSWITPNLDFKDNIIRRWISMKWYKIETQLQWHINRNLHTHSQPKSNKTKLSYIGQWWDKVVLPWTVELTQDTANPTVIRQSCLTADNDETKLSYLGQWSWRRTQPTQQWQNRVVLHRTVMRQSCLTLDSGADAGHSQPNSDKTELSYCGQWWDNVVLPWTVELAQDGWTL